MVQEAEEQWGWQGSVAAAVELGSELMEQLLCWPGLRLCLGIRPERLLREQISGTPWGQGTGDAAAEKQECSQDTLKQLTAGSDKSLLSHPGVRFGVPCVSPPSLRALQGWVAPVQTPAGLKVQRSSCRKKGASEMFE